MPGVIGDLVELLQVIMVNISDFRLGRDSNSQALAVVKVDDNVNKSLLQELSSLETCISVAYVVI